jgi:hypothetical protein
MKWPLCLLLTALISSIGQAQRLSLPVRTDPITHEYTNQPPPRYSYGFLLAFDPNAAQIWSYRDGILKTNTKIVIPGVNSLRIRHVACSPDGILAASVALSNPQLGFTSAIVWIDQAGKIIRVIRTSPFAVGAVTYSSDGHLWALGRTRDDTYHEVAEYNILREYNSDGILVRTLLPKSVVLGSPSPATGRLYVRGGQILICFEEANVVVQLASAGNILGQWKLDTSPELQITGAALTESGNIIISGTVQLSPPQASNDRLYQLDKVSGRLLPINTGQAVSEREYSILVGGESEYLVLYVKPPRRLELVKVE